MQKLYVVLNLLAWFAKSLVVSNFCEMVDLGNEEQFVLLPKRLQDLENIMSSFVSSRFSQVPCAVSLTVKKICFYSFYADSQQIRLHQFWAKQKVTSTIQWYGVRYTVCNKVFIRKNVFKNRCPEAMRPIMHLAHRILRAVARLFLHGLTRQ